MKNPWSPRGKRKEEGEVHQLLRPRIGREVRPGDGGYEVYVPLGSNRRKEQRVSWSSHTRIFVRVTPLALSLRLGFGGADIDPVGITKAESEWVQGERRGCASFLRCGWGCTTITEPSLLTHRPTDGADDGTGRGGHNGRVHTPHPTLHTPSLRVHWASVDREIVGNIKSIPSPLRKIHSNSSSSPFQTTIKHSSHFTLNNNDFTSLHYTTLHTTTYHTHITSHTTTHSQCRPS